MKLRSSLYLLAQILGDLSAARHGSIIKRIQRRMMGRFTGKHMIGKMVKRR